MNGIGGAGQRIDHAQAKRVGVRHVVLALQLLLAIQIAPPNFLSFAQTATPNQNDAVLAAGSRLLSQLKLDPRQDAGIFKSVGMTQAAAALTAVMAKGQATTATADDWVDLHRALSALIELNELRGDFLRAAIYAYSQSIYYRNNEQDYTTALAAAREALDLQQRSGQSATQYINWGNIGQNLASLGRFDEAIDSYRQAQKRIDDPSSPQAANVWRDLVQAELAGHHLDATRSEVAEFMRQARFAPPLFHARALMAQLDLQIEEGDYPAVLDSIHGALQLMTGQAQDATFSYEAAAQLMTCVLASTQTLSYDKAIALAKRIDTDFPGLPFSVSPFARLAIRMRRRLAGDLDGILREDLARLDNARTAGDVPGQIEALQSLAVSYQAANSIHQEILSLQDALNLEKSMAAPTTIAERATGDEFYFQILGSLGDAYTESRDLSQARHCYDEMLRGIKAVPEIWIRGKLDRRYAQAFLGKARVAELDDDPDTARDMLQQALNQGSTGPGKFDRSEVLLQWARLERSLGEQPAEAVKLYEQSIQAFREERIQLWEIIARLEYAKYLALPPGSRLPDALSKAQEDLRVVEDEAKAAQFADAEWQIRFIQGIMDESANHIDAAIEHYETAVARLEQIRSDLSQEEQRQNFMDNAMAQELYQRLIALLLRAGRQGEAWEYLERSKARSFLEMLRGRHFHTASPSPEVAQLHTLEQQIINLRVQLTPTSVGIVRGAGHDPAVLHDELHQLEAKFTLARQQADLKTTRAGQTYSLLPTTLTETQKLLSRDTALLEYSILSHSLVAFIVTHESRRQMTWKIDPRDLRRKVLQLRTLLADPGTASELNPILDAVSAMVVSPLSRRLPDRVKHLIIVPTDYLSYLPFQVLLWKGGRPLIEAYSISYLPSASSLEFLPRKLKLRGNLFLGALGATAVDGMPPLPGTLEETAGIAKVYPEAERVTGNAFTHDEVVEALSRFQEVHLATHGLLDERAPLFSALLTSPAPHEPSRLSLYEVTDMKLRAKLVVLSACETGLGKLQRGDEVTGLTRTFLLAGASTVVSSLWKVSDDSTALLMEGFYSGLKSGQSPAQAMRESALAVRKQYPHPFFWAPFIVTGAQ